MPQTPFGRWSAALLAAAFAFFLVFFGFAASGLRGGEAFFDNLWLAAPFGMAAVSALLAGGFGVISMVSAGERSVLVTLAVVVAAVAAFFIGAEILLPH